MEDPQSIPIMIMIFLVLIASCSYAVIGCTKELLKYIRIKKSGHLVPGKIIDFKEGKSSDDVTYFAVVSYMTTLGEKIIAKARSASDVKPTIGKEVRIIYSPSNPSHFYFQKSIVPYGETLAILMFGSGIILLTIELLKII